MKRIFLTSDLGCSEKVDGVRVAKDMNNLNGFVDQIKNALTKTEKIVFFASTPSDYSSSDFYSKLTLESFGKAGIVFSQVIIIDDRYNGNIASEVEDADLLFLSGGNTENQMIFFERIGLRDIVKKYEGTIVGQSAGAMNLAEEVLCSPEDISEIGNNYKWPGLSLTSISIEPHFTLRSEGEEKALLRKELLKISSYRPLYAICDGTHIYIDDESATIFGEAYLIDNGVITKINDNGKTLSVIDKLINRSK